MFVDEIKSSSYTQNAIQASSGSATSVKQRLVHSSPEVQVGRANAPLVGSGALTTHQKVAHDQLLLCSFTARRIQPIALSSASGESRGESARQVSSTTSPSASPPAEATPIASNASAAASASPACTSSQGGTSRSLTSRLRVLGTHFSAPPGGVHPDVGATIAKCANS